MGHEKRDMYMIRRYIRNVGMTLGKLCKNFQFDRKVSDLEDRWLGRLVVGYIGR